MTPDERIATLESRPAAAERLIRELYERPYPHKTQLNTIVTRTFPDRPIVHLGAVDPNIQPPRSAP